MSRGAWLGALLLAGCAASPRPAPPVHAPSTPASSCPSFPGVEVTACTPDGRVSLTARDADLADVLEAVGECVDRNLLVDPRIVEHVTCRYRAVPWRDIVDDLARLGRCEMQKLPRGIVLFSRPFPQVSAALYEGSMPVDAALKLLASVTRIRLERPQDLRGPLVPVYWELASYADVHQLVRRIVRRCGGNHRVEVVADDHLRIVEIGPELTDELRELKR